MFKKMSLRTKLLLVSCTVNFCLVLLVALSLNALHRVEKEYQYIVEVSLKKANLLADGRGSAKDITRNVIRLSLPGNSREELDYVEKKLKKLEDSFNDVLDKYRSLPRDPKENELYTSLNDAVKIFIEANHKTIAQSLKDGDTEKALALQMLKTEYRKSYDDVLFPALNKLVDFQRQQSDQQVLDANKTKDQANLLMIASGIIITIFSLALMFAFSTSISKSLHKIAISLGLESSKVATASQELAASSTELSNVSTEQSASIQETSSTIEEISAMIAKTADSTSASRGLAHSCQESAEKGRKAVVSMLQSMTDISSSNTAIKSQVDANNQNLSDIVRVISEIGTKTKVINDIVFQTKLLSFNASVEAARAGEHGKGFAVVAEEVGNLAQMSGNAAKEITSMLDESIKRVDEIVRSSQGRIENLIHSAQAKVSDGTEVAHQCSKNLEEITAQISELSKMISEIDSATGQQSTGVREVNTAIASLSEGTQQNTIVAGKTSKSAEELSSQAHDLKALIQQLTQIVEGSHSTHSSFESEERHKMLLSTQNQTTNPNAPDLTGDLPLAS